MENDDLSQLWMVPYADLMSTLVLLFMSLFAYAYSERSPEYDRALAHLANEMSDNKESRHRLEETDLAVKIKSALNDLSLREFGVQVTERAVKLTLPSPVLFDEGSTTLSPDAAHILTPLSQLFAHATNPIQVDGHTDNIPIKGGRLHSNWELSAARAFSVIEFLMAQGLPPERFHARGHGEFMPVATNNTPEGRAQNRRIEISLIREIKQK